MYTLPPFFLLTENCLIQEEQMIKYILKRLGLGVLTLFILVVITFTMTKLMPGSPLQSKNVSGRVTGAG